MPSVAEFLIERLETAGVKHVFGIPGDYVLQFVNCLSNNDKIKFVNTTDENHAGFAADAYARTNGIGCVCATYNVGALKLCNAVAGAYAEKSPMVVISGSPGIKERNEDFLLHHVVKGFDNQLKIFQNITCYSAALDDPTQAGYKIDAAISALKRFKQPVYLELPRDIADKPLRYDVYSQGTPSNGSPSDPENLKDALDEVGAWVRQASNPVILAGVQITRFNLGSQLVRFAERHNIPMVTTMLSKSTVDEHHPLFAGVYCGPYTTQEEVRKLVDDSDCLMIFGEMLTDLTLGFQSPKFTKRQTVRCSTEGLKVHNHSYAEVKFLDFCERLFKLDLGKRSVPELPEKVEVKEFIPEDVPITTARFFQKIQSILTNKTAVVADIGECLFGASELKVSHHNFFSPAFYCSMGCAIPGALGVALAKPGLRPIVLVGDGAFQMSCTELSTFLDYGLNPIVFVLNNKGYTTERFLLDGKFNDIRNWEYHKIVEMIGGKGFVATTELGLEEAVNSALKERTLSVINVSVEPKDISIVLRRMVENLAKRV